jgi:YHS domain-containing protein
MNKKFQVEKTESLWKVKYEVHEWYFQSLEDLCLFMENHLDNLEKIKPFMISDECIN